MRSVPISGERPLHWVGSSKKDLLAMPQPVRRAMGVVLGVAQQGGKHPAAKTWKGEGSGLRGGKPHKQMSCSFVSD